ncbi:MAG: folylpolyglutamate synthase/dihydrofolate synthase family protein [Saprospiraceae bacterium]|nr:folylpolyglutamate synthase/dihydrofolate synthase family protein [Saprospiraceae bacterium]
MTYSETLTYLYQSLPMFTRIGTAAFKKDLTNTLALVDVLDNPHLKFPQIHIGGTNGKGSTAHITAAILQSMGLKVGLYVSPHYRDFRERIKINGEYISKKAVVQFVERNRPHFESIQPSFFEMTVAMAFDYFATEGVDIAVIEVGLGGRFDSTNIISPLMSVITNISFDHMDMLGNTLPLIAFEKAGIIKAHTPVVIGEEQEETKLVFEQKAAQMNAPISFASQIFEVKPIHQDFDYTTFQVFKQNKLVHEALKVNVGGDYQAKNVATVLQVFEIFKDLQASGKFKTDSVLTTDVIDQAVQNGLLNLTSLTNFIGRWQVIGREPIILCDSAHNEGGLILAMNQLNSLVFNKLHIVLGVVKDKDISKMLYILPPNATYYFAKADIPRGLDADILRGMAEVTGRRGKAYKSVRQALAAAKKSAKKEDLIYVGGSIFVLAEVI